jgi:hypothetical protein
MQVTELDLIGKNPKILRRLKASSKTFPKLEFAQRNFSQNTLTKQAFNDQTGLFYMPWFRFNHA